MKISKRVKVVLISISAPILFIVAFLLVIIAYNQFHQPPEVDVMATAITPQNIEITEGQSIRFVNRSSSTTQILCLGSNRSCDGLPYLTLQLPPPEFKSPGLRLVPGQAKDIVFDADGTFHVTSTVVPGINLTVTVAAAG